MSADTQRPGFAAAWQRLPPTARQAAAAVWLWHYVQSIRNTTTYLPAPHLHTNCRCALVARATP